MRMNRLSEYDIVAVALPEDGFIRDATFKCRVIAMAGTTVALEPLDKAQVTWLPERVPGAFMVFRHERSLVALKGVLVQPETVGDLRFKVTDGVQIQRRAASRIKIVLPVALRPAGTEIEEVQGLTANLSADGMLVECALDARPGAEVELTMSLPGSDEPVEAVATVARAHEGLLALEFSGASRTARERLARLVVERNRATLHREQLVADGLDF